MGTSGEEPMPEITPIDELFKIKNGLVSYNRLNKNHVALSRQILEILEDHPECAKTLLSWGFPEYELLYVMRSGCFRTAITLATLIVHETSTIPSVYLSKAFLFFLTSKLSQAYEFTGTATVSGNIPAEHILKFATELIRINRESARTLYSSGFFILAAAIITSECCELYNSIFEGIHYWADEIPGMPVRSVYSRQPASKIADTVYEIHRKQFDPEIIFCEQDTFVLKDLQISYQKSVFDQIYSECKNMYHLIEQDTRAMLDMMLYKRITYVNETLLLLIAEKNPKAVKYYRQALEAGVVPDESLINSFVQMLDIAEMRLDAALCLWHYMNSLNGHRGFNESRIKSIFQCLEFRCTVECPRENGSVESNSHSLDESFPRRGICSRLRILTLLKKLYEWVPEKYFYLPSHLILVKSCTQHCQGESQFINKYFAGFLAYISKDSLNVARVLFPLVKERKRSKEYVEIRMEDDIEDADNFMEDISVADNGITLNKRNRIVESDDYE